MSDDQDQGPDKKDSTDLNKKSDSTDNKKIEPEQELEPEQEREPEQEPEPELDPEPENELSAEEFQESEPDEDTEQKNEADTEEKLRHKSNKAVEQAIKAESEQENLHTIIHELYKPPTSAVGNFTIKYQENKAAPKDKTEQKAEVSDPILEEITGKFSSEPKIDPVQSNESQSTESNQPEEDKSEENKPQSSFTQMKGLPPLKPTLNLTDCGFDFWHDRVWILNDFVENKYFYLGRVEYEIISRWNLGSAEKIIDKVNSETVLTINEDNVENVFRFLLNSNLMKVGSKVISQIKKARENPVLMAAKNVGKMFFLRIPLINPDKFLNKTSKIGNIVFSKTFLYFICALAFIDVYLLASNWGGFTGSLPGFTDFSSIVLILFTMIFSKVIHEFGHAYACKKYGGSVPEMGVTFIFFYPLFYTDATSSMMFDSKKRLVVSTAGIRMEMYLAVLAGFFWFFVEDNTILKNLLFFTAAISWLVSIAFNAVPFIKFDGYFILSDYLKIRNLSMRAVAILKYYIRRYLFGIEAAYPESYNKNKFKFFMIFSLMTGVYRIFLFSVIFLFLYYIKIVGFLFFILALAFMVFFPLTKELINIWKLRSKIKNTQNLQVTLAVTSVLLLIICMPIRNNIYMPAVLFAKTQRVYAPFQSQIKSIDIKINDKVNKGQTLMGLFSSRLDSEKIINLLNIETESYYSFGTQLSSEFRKQLLSKKSDIQLQKIIEENIQIKNDQLEIIAPFTGRITAIKDGIYENTWLRDKAWLFDIVDFNEYYLHAYIKSNDMNEIKFTNDTQMVFVPDRREYSACAAVVKSISNQPVEKIPSQPLVPLSLAHSTLLNSNLLFFATHYGGTINLQRDDSGNWVPIDSYFTLELEPDMNDEKNSCKYGNQQIVKGIIKVKGSNKSIIYTLYQKIRRAFTRLS